MSVGNKMEERFLEEKHHDLSWDVNICRDIYESEMLFIVLQIVSRPTDQIISEHRRNARVVGSFIIVIIRLLLRGRHRRHNHAELLGCESVFSAV
jgi:hypothetical protein